MWKAFVNPAIGLCIAGVRQDQAVAMEYCSEFTALCLSFTARKTDAISVTAWGGGSLHYKPRRVWLLSTPLITLSTVIHQPHLEMIYLPLPLKGHQLRTESPSIFPWNKGGKRPFLPKPLIAIPKGTAGNMGCKFPNKGPSGMPLRRYTASQLIQQMYWSPKELGSPQVKTEWKRFLSKRQRNPCGPRDLKDMSKTPSMECARHKKLLHVDFRSRLNMTFSAVGESTQAAQLPAQKTGSRCFIDLANEWVPWPLLDWASQSFASLPTTPLHICQAVMDGLCQQRLRSRPFHLGYVEISSH